MAKIKSLSEQVYEYIVHQIKIGTLSFEEKINETDLIQQLGISRTPIREALIQLASDGILENVPRKGFYVNTKGYESVLICPQGTDYTAVQEMLRKAVVEIMRRHAKRFLPQRLDAIANKYGFTYNAVSIRSSRTRWGSCSAGRNIALSLYLMALPSELIDYVIKHELCHTVEMNHGPRFWNLMDKVTDCKAKELRNRVREHGMLII